VDAMDAHQAICNHVHLPVQSGSTRVLQAMQRTYSRDEYLEKIRMIRRAKRRSAITTDMIVGFPGETAAEFDETLSLLDEVKYDGVFSFKYSPRPNTPASSMGDAIPEEEKSRRLGLLQEKQRMIQAETLRSLAGEIFEVHVDGKSKKETSWYGHSSCNRVINLNSAKENLLGKYVNVRVIGCTPNSLLGEHLP
jgi:tRNA-2-methylthio-N6-dimethylallyladenosine synthase